VESIPGKRSGAWVFKGTRMPISTVFENLQDMNVDELVEEFGVTREQVRAVLAFAAHSAEAPPPARNACFIRQRHPAHSCAVSLQQLSTAGTFQIALGLVCLYYLTYSRRRSADHANSNP
jgi:uncharacterized protein (DUF433 family)